MRSAGQSTPAANVRDPVGPCGGLRRQLEAVLSDDCDAGNPDEALDVGAGATADAGDERVTRGEPRKLVPRLLRDPRVLWPLDDRRERAVDVEEDRGRPRLRREP